MASKTKPDPEDEAAADDDAATDEDAGDVEVDAGLVPKGDTGDDAIEPEPDPAPAPESPDAGPPPVTPTSSAQAARDRVAFEDGVNARVDSFLAASRAAVTDAYLQGGTVELAITLPDD